MAESKTLSGKAVRQHNSTDVEGLPQAGSDGCSSRAKLFSRRKLLKRVIVGGAMFSAGSAAYAVGIEPVWPVWQRVPMAYPGLGDGLIGTRIIHISDLHLGATSLSYLRSCMGRIADAAPDLVVVTGDIIQGLTQRFLDPAADLFQAAGLAGRSIVVLGNHDWGSVCRQRSSQKRADSITKRLRQAGITVLRNQKMPFQRAGDTLNIAGLEDYCGKAYDAGWAGNAIANDAPTLVLTHNPDSFVDLATDQPAWALAGHTHGGQVSIPFFGPPLVPLRRTDYVSGRYQRGRVNLYVNPGLGWLRRIRFNARPEITEFTLCRA